MDLEIKRMTAIEIIEETVAFYAADPANRRSLGADEENNKICLYKSPNGNSCAFARCWKEGVWRKEYELQTPVTKRNVGTSNECFILPEPDELVKDKYKGHSRDFWRRIQELHDDKDCWDLEEKKLSKYGESIVKHLKEKYKDK